ncbi:MAG: penicillin-binding protein 2 [Bacteroidales bacterium]|nr:penicillin-binding protein 2 [Bacteroidales bacterium]
MINQYFQRKYIIGGIILLAGLVLLFRLFYLQVVNSSYKLSAENNSKREVIQYPARGLMYDRNGTLLVSNQAAYDVMLTPGQLDAFDTISFIKILGISLADVRSGIKKAKEYSSFAPSVFMKQVSGEIASVLQEQLYKFPGFFVQTRTLRKYPRNIAAHLMGYVGEVDKNIIGNNPYYQMGDYIGISGVEKRYEEILRGVKGKKNYLVDVHSRITGSYQGGRFDVPAKIGKDITLTIDADLQEYGESLMKNFTGSIVAIEPSSGEMLCMVSTPSYPPDLLVGRGLSHNFNSLSSDTLNPLFNRAIAASYPPGSTFKLINALVGLQEKVITPATEFGCQSGYAFKGQFLGCHSHRSPLDLREGIQNSCNSYFVNVFRRIMEDPKFGSTDQAFNNWRKHLLSFGLGNTLNSDLSGELKGFIPKDEYYNKYYGKDHWNFLTIRSLAIGQGELGVTPLQMANLTSAIANQGYYITPHVLKAVIGEESIDPAYLERHYTSIDTTYFPIVIDGMELAVNGGAGSTAGRAKIEGIVVCGKTGTAENPHGEDHSIFIAFAPRENPKIAIAVYIENGGFGGTWAAPVASLMIEKYLTREVKRKYLEDYIYNAEIKRK